MTDRPLLNWGIIGPGTIARDFAAGLAHSRTGRLVAIGSRNPGRPGLAEAFPGIRCHAGYAALLADPAVEAVYIASPHTEHAEWALNAVRAGKHVLVEKPMTPTAAGTAALFAAAEQAGVFMGEAYMYRLHPTIHKLVALIQGGMLGEVRLIRSSFGYNKGAVVPEHRLFDPQLAGGGILDIGGYPVSMAGLIAGAAAGVDYLEPVALSASGQIGATGVDEWASAVLHYGNGIVAEVSCSIRVSQDNMLTVMGSAGRLAMQDFWFAGGKQGGTATLVFHDNAGAETRMPLSDDGWLYAYEADAVHAALSAGQRGFAWPGMSARESVANMAVLDRWRAAIGLRYPFE